MDCLGFMISFLVRPKTKALLSILLVAFYRDPCNGLSTMIIPIYLGSIIPVNNQGPFFHCSSEVINAPIIGDQ